MDCQETARQLNGYVDRELSEEEVKQVRSHLDDCPPCQHCFEFQAELKRLVRKECSSEDTPERLRQWLQKLLARTPGPRTRDS
jgi:mycothiol system anti-sigma-R factor